MTEENNTKIQIDNREKKDKEIFETYLKIAAESNIQRKIYNQVNNEKLASKIYELYKKSLMDKNDR